MVCLKRVLISVFIFQGIFAYAQSYKINFNSVKQTAGINYLKDSSIYVVGHELPGEIKSINKLEESFGDTSKYLVFLKSPEKKYPQNRYQEFAMIYDFISGTQPVIREFNYSDYTDLRISGNKIMYSEGLKYIARDIYTWKKCWKINNPVVAVRSDNKTAISYITETMSSEIHSVKAVNLETGNSIWVKPTDKDWVIRDAVSDDTSVVILGSKFLSSYNYANGKGWKIPVDNSFVVDAKYTGQDLLITAVGAISAAITGFGFYSYGTPETVYTTGSHILYDSGIIYFATSTKICSLDFRNLTTVWEKEVPYEETGMSSVFTDDSCLYVINYGFVASNKKMLNRGNPYLVVYDKINGDFKYVVSFGEKIKMITDYRANNGKVLISSENSLFLISLSDGNILAEKSKTSDEFSDYGRLISIRDLYIYDETARSFKLVQDIDFAVIGKSGKVYLLDDGLNIAGEYSKDSIVRDSYSDENMMLFKSGKDLYVTDLNGNVISELFNSSFQIIIDGRLFFSNNKTLFSVEVSDLL